MSWDLIQKLCVVAGVIFAFCMLFYGWRKGKMARQRLDQRARAEGRAEATAELSASQSVNVSISDVGSTSLIRRDQAAAFRSTGSELAESEMIELRQAIKDHPVLSRAFGSWLPDEVLAHEAAQRPALVEHVEHVDHRHAIGSVYRADHAADNWRDVPRRDDHDLDDPSPVAGRGRHADPDVVGSAAGGRRLAVSRRVRARATSVTDRGSVNVVRVMQATWWGALALLLVALVSGVGR